MHYFEADVVLDVQRPAGDHWQKAESHEGLLLQVENQKHQDRRFPQKKGDLRYITN